GIPSQISSARHAERTEPDEQFRVHRCANVNNHRSGCDQPARGSRARVLSPQRNPLDEVHIVLTVATLLLLVLQWWVTFRWNTEANWTFDKFLVLTAWTVTLYLLTVFLYPPDLSEAEEHQGRFERNRSGYYSTFIAMCLLDIAQTAVH